MKPWRVAQRADTDAASVALRLSRAAMSSRPERDRLTLRATRMHTASHARVNHSMARSSSRSTRPHSRGRVTVWGISSGNTFGLRT